MSQKKPIIVRLKKVIDVFDLEIAAPKDCEWGYPIKIRIELLKYCGKETYDVNVLEQHPYHILPSEVASSFEPSNGYYSKEFYAVSEGFGLFEESLISKTKEEALNKILLEIENRMSISIDREYDF